MARYQVAPTKNNLLNLKQEQKFVTEGHSLLEQKRDILVAELMGMVNTAAEVQERVDTNIIQAYKFLDKAIVKMGLETLKDLALNMPIRNDVSISSRKIMGVSVPQVDVSISEKKPYYSFLTTEPELDEAVMKFRDILDMLAKLAQTSVTVFRLAKESQKTVRRVNALEKIYLPDYKDSINYIQSSLEESERESFFTLKLIKKKLKSKQDRR